MNRYEWLDAYLLAKTGACKDYKQEWGWLRYQVGGKLFAATLHPSEQYDPAYAGKDLLNLKCDPILSELLRKQHTEVLPGFYSDKRTWISVDLGGSLPDELVKQLCDESYQQVFGKLTKKLQREIAGAVE